MGVNAKADAMTCLFQCKDLSDEETTAIRAGLERDYWPTEQFVPTTRSKQAILAPGCAKVADCAIFAVIQLEIRLPLVTPMMMITS